MRENDSTLSCPNSSDKFLTNSPNAFSFPFSLHELSELVGRNHKAPKTAVAALIMSVASS